MGATAFQSVEGGLSGGAAAVATPLTAIGGSAGRFKLSLIGVLLFLLALWGAMKIARFRFTVETGVGR